MRAGKVKESILKRSVLKKIKYKSPELLNGPSVGRDCSTVCVDGKNHMVFTGNPVTASADVVGKRAFYTMANDISAAGARPAGMLVNILLPEGSEESELKDIMQQICVLADKYKVDILGGHTEVSPVVSAPLLCVTGIGYIEPGCAPDGRCEPGMDIVMTKWAGALEAADLSRAEREVLESRFTADFLEQVEKYSDSVSCVEDAEIALGSGASVMHNISSGGVFGALWELGELTGMGLQVELKKIPVCQETVEICEFFDRNPYMISSGGALLVVIRDGESLIREYEKAGIAAAVIGQMSGGNDRVIINGDERRFLVPSGN